MSLEEVREKARRFHVKTRRNNVLGAIFQMVGIAFCVVVVFTARGMMPRVVGGLVVAVVVGDWIRNRRLWPPALPSSEAATAPALEYYRQELLRELEYAGFPKSRLVIAAVIVVLLIWQTQWRAANPPPVRIILPFVLLNLGFMILLFYVRIREARKLRRELAELEEFESSL